MPRTRALRNFEVLAIRRRGFETTRSPAPAALIVDGRRPVIEVPSEVTGPTRFAALPADGGSASNSGNELAPWTIEYALTRLQPGDTLRIKGAGPWAHEVGTWEGGALNPSNSGTASAPITIMSHVPREFTLTGSTYTDSEGVQHRAAIGCLRRNHIHYKNFRVVNGMVKMRGDMDNPTVYRGVVFDGMDVVGGAREGTDNSLKWGIVVMGYVEFTIRNNRVTMSNWVSSYNGDNSAAIDCFVASDGIIEHNYADATNVYSAYGQKAGACHRNIIRYNIACNARSGVNGTEGAGFYTKANTGYAGEPNPCEDNEFYGNIVWNAYRAFQQNHGVLRTKVFNNTARNVDWFYRQWQTNNVDAEMYNNICRGNGSTRFMEFEAGASSVLATLLKKSNHNCAFSTGSNHCYIGGTSISLAGFPTSGLTTGVQGREANSVAANPLFVSDADAGDFHLQASSPCLGAGEGGVNMGAYITGSEVIGPDWI
jgi:hypothetical protein